MIDLDLLRNATQKMREREAAARAIVDKSKKQISKLDEKRESLESGQRTMRQASILIGKAADEARSQLKNSFEAIVSAALRTVFDQGYKFHTILENKKNATWATFAVSSDDDKTMQDPLFARGGSVVDVCAIALRFAYLQESCMPGMVLLDEPGKNVSEKHREATASMIDRLQKITGRQIIMVTHHREFKDFFPNTIELGDD